MAGRLSTRCQVPDIVQVMWLGIIPDFTGVWGIGSNRTLSISLLLLAAIVNIPQQSFYNCVVMYPVVLSGCSINIQHLSCGRNMRRGALAVPWRQLCAMEWSLWWHSSVHTRRGRGNMQWGAFPAKISCCKMCVEYPQDCLPPRTMSWLLALLV